MVFKTGHHHNESKFTYVWYFREFLTRTSRTILVFSFGSGLKVRRHGSSPFTTTFSDLTGELTQYHQDITE